MKIPKVILGRPKIIFDTCCPKCKSHDISPQAIIDLFCKNCKTKFTSEAKANIWQQAIAHTIKYLQHHNEVWIVGQRTLELTSYTETALKPENSFDDEYYNTLVALRESFRKLGCFDYSEIIEEDDYSLKKECTSCGYCYNCVTCTKCKETYSPNNVKDKKRYTCPECGHKKYKLTQFIRKDNKSICPHCESNNVKHTVFHSDRTQCPVCDTKITSKKIPVYKLVIKRQPRNIIGEKHE